MAALDESNVVRDVIEKAKVLSAGQRALIARCLISSLDATHDDGVERAWGELAEKRYEEIVSGKVLPVSWDEVTLPLAEKPNPACRRG